MKNTNTTNTTITFSDVTKALASIDERFTLYDDASVYAKAYCSIRLILKDKSIDTRRVFCLYMNTKCITIHCAVRFASVCDNNNYHLNTRKSEYTKSVTLDELAQHVNALLTHECERLKMSAYTERKTSATQRKQTNKKAK